MEDKIMATWEYVKITVEIKDVQMEKNILINVEEKSIHKKNPTGNPQDFSPEGALDFIIKTSNEYQKEGIKNGNITFFCKENEEEEFKVVTLEQLKAILSPPPPPPPRWKRILNKEIKMDDISSAIGKLFPKPKTVVLSPAFSEEEQKSPSGLPGVESLA